jgi:signal transduction histidine kinase
MPPVKHFLPAKPGLPTLAVLAIFLLSLLFIYHVHLVVGREVVFTHALYIPIALASLRWGLAGTFWAAFLGANLVAAHLLSGSQQPVADDLMRALMFILVALVLGWEVARNRRLQMDVLVEKERNLEQMRSHLAYVQRVAHELRNPLQTLMGSLDALRGPRTREERQTLSEIQHRSAEHLRASIDTLTSGQS